ncbi:hypothetical protein GMORB2_3741 [Geosmithia morbida]|uniref:Uncharacterized protein n=1 Tax=Geosmithia morbida TaxID=1094350 RepID=A0A9P4YYL6_9HYPO|nr:uncharacterized protein GMORB2_3741 [Geosmithia morbida]KAF4124902.1 hypothetical protein GMORB2_3741 [Geosmithia morbida]
MLPSHLLIYHAGTTRTTFLALVKVTTLLVGFFFCGVMAPKYLPSSSSSSSSNSNLNSGSDTDSDSDTNSSSSDSDNDTSREEEEEEEDPSSGDRQLLALSLLCGVIPTVFVAYVTSPFVTHIHLHLPPLLKTRQRLSEIVQQPGRLPLSDLKISLTTMSFIAKPRYTTLPASELLPRRGRGRGRGTGRLGVVNYTRSRDGASLRDDRASRSWYVFPPVLDFYIQPGRPGSSTAQSRTGARRRYQEPSKADRVSWWVWEAIKQEIDGKQQLK